MPTSSANAVSAFSPPENEDKDVCKQLNTVPGLPTPSSTGGPGPIPTGVPTLPRPGFDLATLWSGPSPTIGELMKHYDASLVSLLVPGMVQR